MGAHYQPAGWCRCGYRVDPGVCPECGRDNPRQLKHNPRHWLRRMLRRSLWLLPVAAVLGGVWLAKDELAVRFMPLDILLRLRNVRDSVRPMFKHPIAVWADEVIDARAQRLKQTAMIDAERRMAALPQPFDNDGVPEVMMSTLPLPGHFLKIRGPMFVASRILAGWNYGQVEIGPDRVKLMVAADRRLPGFDCPTTLVRGSWDGCPILVDEEWIEAFCNRVNAGDVVIALQLHTYWSGEPFNLNQTPILSPPYEDWLLGVPLTLLVLESPGPGAARPRGEFSLDVRLDRGRLHGVRLHMPLYPEAVEGDQACRAPAVYVREVSDDSCVARFTFDDQRSSVRDRPQPGDLFSTRDARIAEMDRREDIEILVDYAERRRKEVP